MCDVSVRPASTPRELPQGACLVLTVSDALAVSGPGCWRHSVSPRRVSCHRLIPGRGRVDLSLVLFGLFVRVAVHFQSRGGACAPQTVARGLYLLHWFDLRTYDGTGTRRNGNAGRTERSGTRHHAGGELRNSQSDGRRWSRFLSTSRCRGNGTINHIDPE